MYSPQWLTFVLLNLVWYKSWPMNIHDLSERTLQRYWSKPSLELWLEIHALFLRCLEKLVVCWWSWTVQRRATAEWRMWSTSCSSVQTATCRVQTTSTSPQPPLQAHLQLHHLHSLALQDRQPSVSLWHRCSDVPTFRVPFSTAVFMEAQYVPFSQLWLLVWCRLMLIKLCLTCSWSQDLELSTTAKQLLRNFVRVALKSGLTICNVWNSK